MEESWNVHTVDYYRSFFKNYIIDTKEFDKSYELTNNLCYNFQHLEFLTKILQKELYSIVRKQTIKTYIIVGSGIIESLLTYYLIFKGIHPKNEWKKEKEKHSDISKESGGVYKTITTKYVKTQNFELSTLKFDTIIQLTKENNLLGENKNIYLNLYEIKNLRNKVHLNNIRKLRDHDWNNFDSKKYYMLTETLREILKSDFFNYETNLLKEKFQFLTIPIFSFKG